MPWGKFKGCRIDEIPVSYLQWIMSGSTAGLRPWLRAEIEKVLGLPEGSTVPKPKPAADSNHATDDLKAAWARVRELHAEVKSLRLELIRVQKNQPLRRDLVRQLVKAWYVAMSRKHHPDHGGSSERMLVVNDCYEDLISRLE
jgi:hypothetical protein